MEWRNFRIIKKVNVEKRNDIFFNWIEGFRNGKRIIGYKNINELIRMEGFLKTENI